LSPYEIVLFYVTTGKKLRIIPVRQFLKLVEV